MLVDLSGFWAMNSDRWLLRMIWIIVGCSVAYLLNPVQLVYDKRVCLPVVEQVNHLLDFFSSESQIADCFLSEQAQYVEVDHRQHPGCVYIIASCAV